MDAPRLCSLTLIENWQCWTRNGLYWPPDISVPAIGLRAGDEVNSAPEHFANSGNSIAT